MDDTLDPTLYTIETVTGRFINLLDPSESQISIDDIAWALSRAPRFAGHTIPLVPYSVGQHSLHVAQIAQSMLNGDFYGKFKNFADRYECESYVHHRAGMDEASESSIYIHGLLHDATECYTGDIPGPLKKIPALRAIIKPIEAKLDEVIHRALGIRYPSSAEHEFIKIADRIAQRIEGHAFMPSRGAGWEGIPEVTLETLQEFEAPESSVAIYRKFINEYNRVKTYVPHHQE